MMKKIPITNENKNYALCELDYTHDHSTVVVGSVMIDRDGIAHEVTLIDKDEVSRRRFWSGTTCLGVQHQENHNMRTKPPFYAHEFKFKTHEKFK